MNPTQIINGYKDLKAQGMDTWLSDCAKTKDIRLSVEMAALARDVNNDKHPHQYRLPNELLQKFADRLLRTADRLILCKTFDELYTVVHSNGLKGIGALTIYDTAQRIGARLKIKPDKVYLHRGTRIGTERYLGRKLKGFTVDKSEFKDFKHLNCAEIEDIMCIYKDSFPLAGKRSGRNANPGKC